MLRLPLAFALAASVVSAQDWARDRVEKSPRGTNAIRTQFGERNSR